MSEKQNDTNGSLNGPAPAPGRALSPNVGVTPVIRVLMVEDDAAFARIAAAILLRATGVTYEVSLASTLNEAERKLAQMTPDVILLDLMLPDSSGMNTVQRMLEFAGDVPLVILSGLDSDKIALDAIHAGAQDYIVKGGDPHAITRAVRYAVERSQSERRLLETEENLRTTQLQLMHAEKMESVGTLAAGIAHEVKNPLAVLQMGIENIELHCQNTTAAAETVQMMKDAVQRASLIVQRLLTFAAPTNCDRKPAMFGEILGRALAMIDFEIRKRVITVRQILDDKLPVLLLDATAIEQVLINLLLNAAQASPDGSTITIRTRQAVLTEVGGDVGRRATDRFPVGIQVVQCDIEDEGPGISPEIERRLFQPFFTTKPPGEGNGLGLCVTRNILELHGGKVELLNRPEGGALARITLIP
jgi:signal transduction histidine kinase